MEEGEAHTVVVSLPTPTLYILDLEELLPIQEGYQVSTEEALKPQEVEIVLPQHLLEQDHALPEATVLTVVLEEIQTLDLEILAAQADRASIDLRLGVDLHLPEVHQEDHQEVLRLEVLREAHQGDHHLEAHQEVLQEKEVNI